MAHGAMGGSDVPQIRQAIVDAYCTEALTIELKTVGEGWWSTRLILVADLARHLTPVQMIVFTAHAKNVGTQSPQVVGERIAGIHPIVRDYENATGERVTADPGRELDHRARIWRDLKRADASTSSGTSDNDPRESDIAVEARAHEIRTWFADCLLDRAIDWDAGKRAPERYGMIPIWPGELVPRQTAEGCELVSKRRVQEHLAHLSVREWASRTSSFRA
jgi:hypothetical protein